MLTANKYIDKLQKIGFDEKQAKQVADKMISFAYFVVDTYWDAKSNVKTRNHSTSVAQPEQNIEKVASIQT